MIWAHGVALGLFFIGKSLHIMKCYGAYMKIAISNMSIILYMTSFLYLMFCYFRLNGNLPPELMKIQDCI